MRLHPPQTIIREPVHTAVWRLRATGALAMDVATEIPWTVAGNWHSEKEGTHRQSDEDQR
jgi:hypothetical protein